MELVFIQCYQHILQWLCTRRASLFIIAEIVNIFLASGFVVRITVGNICNFTKLFTLCLVETVNSNCYIFMIELIYSASTTSEKEVLYACESQDTVVHEVVALEKEY